MSKIFEAMQKAQEHSADPMISSAKKANSPEPEPKTDTPVAAEPRPQHSYRQIKLPRATAVPSLISGSHSAMEAYRTLRTRLRRLQETRVLRSIVVCSPMSGEGKTLTSMNLALCFAQLHEVGTLLVDGDLRKRDLTRLLGNPPAPGLGEILAGNAEPDQAVLSTDVANLHVLGAGAAHVSPPELYSRDRWREFLEWSAQNFSVVLVDSPPILTVADFELIAGACDGILLVVKAMQTNRESLRKLANQLDPAKLLGVVMNGTDPDSKDVYEYAEKPVAR
jgi:protein-tyrosine kinase